MKPFDAHGYVQVQGLRVFHARLHLHWTGLGLAAFLLMAWIVPLLWRERRDRGTAKRAAQELLRRLR